MSSFMTSILSGYCQTSAFKALEMIVVMNLAGVDRVEDTTSSEVFTVNVRGSFLTIMNLE